MLRILIGVLVFSLVFSFPLALIEVIMTLIFIIGLIKFLLDITDGKPLERPRLGYPYRVRNYFDFWK